MCYRNNSFRRIKVFALCDKSKYFFSSSDLHQCYEQIIKEFLQVVNKHASFKKKTVRGTDAPFMSEELRKAIYSRNCSRNKFCKYPSEDELTFKKQRNKYVNLSRKSIKLYLTGITDKGLTRYS